ncbi:MAG: hypothetical protein IKY94_09410 [Lachnospiraceae bacterium]|nr:hypothetical protein [Lachnospiraceae bacterium]
MVAVFLELVKRVGIFVIIGQTILHFGIGKAYEKYIKLVISFMVAAQIVFAFGAYFEKDRFVAGKWGEEYYYENWNQSMKALEEEFHEKQMGVTMNLQQRFAEQEEMVPEKDENSGNEVKIEKIVIQ